MNERDPTNGELMVHLLYLRAGVDAIKTGQQDIEQKMAAAEGDIKVLKERIPRQASGWGSLAGIVGGFLGGVIQGVFRH